jgi:hypothetical protein
MNKEKHRFSVIAFSGLSVTKGTRKQAPRSNIVSKKRLAKAQASLILFGNRAFLSR